MKHKALILRVPTLNYLNLMLWQRKLIILCFPLKILSYYVYVV